MEYGKIQNLKQQGNVITIEFEKQYAIQCQSKEIRNKAFAR